MNDSRTHVTYYRSGAPGTTPRRQPPRHIQSPLFLAQRDRINMRAMIGPRLFVSRTGGSEVMPIVRALWEPLQEVLLSTTENAALRASQQISTLATTFQRFAKSKIHIPQIVVKDARLTKPYIRRTIPKTICHVA